MLKVKISSNKYPLYFTLENYAIEIYFRMMIGVFWLFLLVVFLLSLQTASLEVNYRNTQTSNNA